RSVHEEYVKAGAEILETNTFGANPVKLSAFNLDADTEKINCAAARLAREAANGDALVVGAIGPLGIRIEPFGPTAKEEAEAFFARQVAGLIEGGVDGFILETFSDLDELHTALLAVRAQSDLPVIAQITTDERGSTIYGTTVETAARQLEEWGADVIGLNCSVGPAAMLDTVERVADVVTTPISAQPNAGVPRQVGDRQIYMASPEYIGQYAKRFIDAGARFVGGCCGTTAEHIAQIRDYVSSVQPRVSHPHLVVSLGEEETKTKETPLEERSPLGKKLATGQFLKNVEVQPSVGWQAKDLIKKFQPLKDVPVDTITVLDSAHAHGRMSALAASSLIERDLGIETIMHYTCRDRNMFGMLSDLLGAAALGLRNILIVSGDPPTQGPYPDSTAVFDIDSIGLTNVVQRLNRGHDPGGNNIGKPTNYVIGIAVNPCSIDMEKEISRFKWKVEAGANFAVTQPIFESEHLEKFLESTKSHSIPVVAGLWPLISLRNAEFLANEVPGVHVPSWVIERMKKAHESGGAEQEGLAIATEVLEKIRSLAAGVHISTPGGKLEAARELLTA
ncbi:MAG: bifunctional homocysteine S-methyltransferase/methylenetetrahydrofolate reductase, partial [Gemmatimonadota bacterium]|nr:bifunctional homocysteine S-methyltransferase/methylenetetrahydrofolate reductase [Gemmatimonadota bacterium]